jgi:hypothetical protein
MLSNSERISIMPNWCENTLRIVPETNAARAMLPQIIELFSSKEETPELSAFQFIYPMPAELKDTTPPKDVPNWYDWRLSHWGTKWEECHPYVRQSGENLLLVSFQTAWAPPIGIFDKLRRLGFDVLATYVEQGMGYAGVWQNGEDKEVLLSGLNEPNENGEYPEDEEILEKVFSGLGLGAELLPEGLGG